MNHLPTAAQHHLHTTELGDCTCHYKERKRERSKRKRENEAHSEIQGAGDTVINITKSTQQRQTKDTTKCENGTTNNIKIFWKPF